jgi:hypothetical protein
MCKQCLRRHQILALLLLVFASTAVAHPPDDLVRKALDDSTFTWRSFSSDGITIFYQEGSFAERHRMMLLRSVKTTVDEVLELLEEPAYEPHLNVFYLESRDEMKRIIGRSYSGFSSWDPDGIFVVLNPEWRSFEKHEFTHVITMGRWGDPDETSRWMIEGIAVYSDGWCREYTVDEIAFQFLSNGQLPTLRELFEDYAKLGEIRAGFSAASLIGYIRTTYGMPALRTLWRDGTGDLKKVLGGEPDQIERSWKLYLKRTVPKDTHVDLDTIDKLGCG